MSDTQALTNLAFQAVRAAEHAAVAAYGWIGRGEKELADQAAVDALRTGLNAMPMKGRIVIGEGERETRAGHWAGWQLRLPMCCVESIKLCFLHM